MGKLLLGIALLAVLVCTYAEVVQKNEVETKDVENLPQQTENEVETKDVENSPQQKKDEVQTKDEENLAQEKTNEVETKDVENSQQQEKEEDPSEDVEDKDNAEEKEDPAEDVDDEENDEDEDLEVDVDDEEDVEDDEDDFEDEDEGEDANPLEEGVKNDVMQKDETSNELAAQKDPFFFIPLIAKAIAAGAKMAKLAKVAKMGKMGKMGKLGKNKRIFRTTRRILGRRRRIFGSRRRSIGSRRRSFGRRRRTSNSVAYRLNGANNCWGSCRTGPCTRVCGAGGFCCRKGWRGCSGSMQQVAPPHYHTCIKYRSRPVSVVRAPVLRFRSLGCWRDTSRRAISGPKQNFPANEVIQRCAAKAKRLGNSVFAVQYNHECFTSRTAGRTYRRYGAIGGCRFGRGGSWRQNVYQLTNSLVFSAPAVQYTPLGCWRDTGRRAISGPKQNFAPNVVIKKCAEKAKRLGNKFFAVQYNHECFTSRNAGRTYYRYGLTDRCRNGRGGSWRQNVYHLENGLARVPAIRFISLGCWRDGGRRAISGRKQNFSPRDVIRRCAAKAKSLGNKFFAVQYNRECFTSRSAGYTYRRYGPTRGCRHGRGGSWRQNVYQLY